MEIQTRVEGNATVVAVAGRLDTITTPEFDARIRRIVETGAHRIVMDLGMLDYLSSAGLRGLLVMAKLLAASGGQVCYANLQENVRSVFEMCGFGQLFRVENSVAAAVAALGEGG